MRNGEQKKGAQRTARVTFTEGREPMEVRCAKKDALIEFRSHQYEDYSFCRRWVNVCRRLFLVVTKPTDSATRSLSVQRGNLFPLRACRG